MRQMRSESFCWKHHTSYSNIKERTLSEIVIPPHFTSGLYLGGFVSFRILGVFDSFVYRERE